MDVVLACVAQAERTGLVLRDLRVVREVMWGAHLRAVRAAWAEDETRKALAQAEAVVLQLESPNHVGKIRLGAQDPRVRPEIIGVLLELAAARAANHTGRKDVEGKVEQYAARLMATWQHASFEDFGRQDEAQTEVATEAETGAEMEAETKASTTGRNWVVANYELQIWAPVFKGMRLASLVLNPKTELAGQLESRLSSLETYLRQAADVVEESVTESKSRRGLDWWRALQSSYV